jgi:ribosomal protein S18 acetylase RimI-like enzyme
MAYPSMASGIRSAHEGDATWVRLLAESLHLEVDVKELLMQPHARIYVVPPDQGFVSAWVVQDELQIQDIGVLPQSRRRGLARALFEHALREEPLGELRLVTLEVRESNQGALEFYRALGFAVVGQRPRYYKGGETALLLTLELPAPQLPTPG